MNIRPMEKKDRETVLQLIGATGMFLSEEVQVAAELIDTYLSQPDQKDYQIDVLEDPPENVAGYACYGPAPMTAGTFDLYWIAVHPRRHRQGLGAALLRHVEDRVRQAHGRLIIIETSSRAPYAPTRGFYQRQGYRETARLPDFYRPGDDLVFFSKLFTREAT